MNQNQNKPSSAQIDISLVPTSVPSASQNALILSQPDQTLLATTQATEPKTVPAPVISQSVTSLGPTSTSSLGRSRRHTFATPPTLDFRQTNPPTSAKPSRSTNNVIMINGPKNQIQPLTERERQACKALLRIIRKYNQVKHQNDVEQQFPRQEQVPRACIFLEEEYAQEKMFNTFRRYRDRFQFRIGSNRVYGVLNPQPQL